jgi:hypothetical protein
MPRNLFRGGMAGALLYPQARLSIHILLHASEIESKRMPPNLLGGESVPRSLISRRVKIPPALFTRIGAEADSGRVSLVRGNLKSLRRSLARSKSEPVVGYAK